MLSPQVVLIAEPVWSKQSCGIININEGVGDSKLRGKCLTQGGDTVTLGGMMATSHVGHTRLPGIVRLRF